MLRLEPIVCGNAISRMPSLVMPVAMVLMSMCAVKVVVGEVTFIHLCLAPHTACPAVTIALNAVCCIHLEGLPT